MPPALSLQRAGDLLYHHFDLLQHLRVPEPDDVVALGSEVFRSLRIVHGTFVMPAAVQLDNETGFDAAEIGEVRTDRKLAAKFGGA